MINSGADRAPEVLTVARLSFPAGGDGSTPISALQFSIATVAEVNPLLASSHYLGPVRAARVCFAGWSEDVLVAAQVWRWPTARMLPADGSWLELSRWCLTPAAGPNAGSRMMGWARREIARSFPLVTTLVSYSDPVHGHSGGLYKASGWDYRPTHIGRRYDLDGVGFPSGNGSWNGTTRSTPKHRWVMDLKRSRRPASGSSDRSNP